MNWLKSWGADNKDLMEACEEKKKRCGSEKPYEFVGRQCGCGSEERVRKIRRRREKRERRRGGTEEKDDHAGVPSAEMQKIPEEDLPIVRREHNVRVQDEAEYVRPVAGNSARPAAASAGTAPVRLATSAGNTARPAGTAAQTARPARPQEKSRADKQQSGQQERTGTERSTLTGEQKSGKPSAGQRKSTPWG